jgi:predicted nucleic acid-binding protein
LKHIVIDASVVLKWYLVDEEFSKKALKILENYVSDKLNLTAPALLEYEVANGLIIAKRKGRVDDPTALKALNGFEALNIELIPLSTLNPKVVHHCNTYSITAYDASYLSLAENLDIPLVTADKKLYNSLKKIKRVKWLGDVSL